MTPSTLQVVVEIIGDRIVGVVLIVGACFCVREICRYKERRAAAHLPPADGGVA